MSKKISIVIVTYKSEKDIFDCIESIYKNLDIDLNELEIIVVDNQSPNQVNMFQNIRNRFQTDIILISNDKNGGYGQGNNVGIRASSAPIILIMNPDVRLIMPIFQKVLKVFENNPETTSVGMRQMIAAKKYGTSFHASHILPGWLWYLVTIFANKLQIYSSRLMYFSGACFFVDKVKFESIGLFDEENFMYGEENDIHYRLTHKYGSHMHYCPSLKYLHLVDQRAPSLDYQLKILNSNILLFEKKGYTRNQVIRRYISTARMQVLIKNIAFRLGLIDKASLFFSQQTLIAYKNMLKINK